MRYGKELRVYLYTNGDFANEKVLGQLRDVGLAEIRFDIAATNYNLKNVELATKYFKDVTVEIPAIPEDEEKVRQAMIKMEEIGVKYLNLHELEFWPANVDEMRKRGYMLKSSKIDPFYIQQVYPAYGSEESVFRLIEFALDNKLKLGINYCSSLAKKQVQHLNKRINSAKRIKEPHEKVNDNGLLEKAVVYEPEAAGAMGVLRGKSIPGEGIFYNNAKKRLEIHPDWVGLLGKGRYNVAIVQRMPKGPDDVEIKIL
jgi:pyruvate formate-lyase activating enzyme-like uncharacterized protein